MLPDQAKASRPIGHGRFRQCAATYAGYRIDGGKAIATMLTWLTARATADTATPPGMIPELFLLREQIMTALLRVATVVGLVSFIVAIVPVIQLGLYNLLAGYAVALALAWAVALKRSLGYHLRGGALIAVLYLLAINELLHFGYSVDAHVYLVGFTLFSLIFFGWRAGVATLLASTTTLALTGWLIVEASYTPLSSGVAPLTLAIVISACLNFVMIIGAVQAGLFALLRGLELAWARERDARAQLQQAHSELEWRVAQRTQDLIAARDATVTAHQTIEEQNHYLSVLYQTTLELLNQRAFPELLQTIVDRASAILDAPFGELMVHEHDELVVRAFTANQSFLSGDRVRRGQAQVSWQAFDTRQPVVLDDYASWGARRAIYNPARLTAIADFPIVVGDTVLGVLALGRSAPGQPFTPAQVQQGQLLSQLIGMVLEQARLYNLALSEIAERRQAEQNLMRQAELLNTQNAELDAFAHTVAHDLKTPLTGLVGHSELLQLNVLAGELDELPTEIDMIIAMGHKMAQIVDAMLLLASVRQQTDVPRQPLDMGRIVREVEFRLTHEIAAAQATIWRPERWPAALGYAPWVEEVWVNYLSNALKYGGPAPCITLGAEEDRPGYVRYWVRDTGPGVSAEQQARLFTSFTRLHAVRVEGHGLGLSIVQRIVTTLGGEVGITSAPGSGATFSFTLPAE